MCNELIPVPRDCKIKWGPWTGDCATSNSVLTREPLIIISTLHGGRKCPEPEEEACPTLPCIFTEGTWGPCVENSAGAELGTRVKTPTITQHSSGGGTACPQTEEEQCFLQGSALCSTIKDHKTFCKNAGDNGLNSKTLFDECQNSICTEALDAALCCKPAKTAAKCDSIPIANRDAFCASYGGKGLIEEPEVASCKTATCKPILDGPTCCKHADCSSIKDADAFCADAGLIQNPENVDCANNVCTISADAGTCCEGGKKCDSIASPDDFCAPLGGSGLVDNADTIKCAANNCTIEADLRRCCKPCPSGKYPKRQEGGEEGNNTCHACEIGQFSTVNANTCHPYCPAGYGAEVDVPIYVNVMLMLDMTGSIEGQWANEIDAAKAYCEWVPLSC